MTRLLAALLLLVPVALAAQDEPPAAPVREGGGLMAGVTGFSGGTWQPSGFEVGLLRPLGRDRAAALWGAVRLGSFVQDQAVVYGSTTGFFTALLGGARVPLFLLAEVGTGENPSTVRIIGSVEAGAEANFNSPMPQGDYMGIGAALVGLSFGGGDGRIEQGFAILVGPALFVGRTTSTVLQVSLRYQNSR